MKYTEYFKYTRSRLDRIQIRDEWILDTIKKPLKTVKQSDGRIKKWFKVLEVGKYLRVILLPDGETVHNAFFDRNFKEDDCES